MTLTSLALDLIEGRTILAMARFLRRTLDRIDPAGSVDGILRAEAERLEVQAAAARENRGGPRWLAAEALRRRLRPPGQPLNHTGVDHA